jgi:glycosyltransferase involved in cell wall biosynthesis
VRKVLAIAPYNYLPWYSGGQKFIAQFFEHLGKETELSVITVKENDFSIAKSYLPLPMLASGFLRYMDPTLPSKISSLIKKEGFDTVIWEHPYYAWLARIIRKRTGVRTILHTHNIEHQRFRSTKSWWWPMLRIYEKWFFKKADRIFFITGEDREFAIRQWKIDPEKCIEVPFGIDISHYPDDRAECRELIRQRHGIAAEETILFFNGLLDYAPNLDALRAILDKINPQLLSQNSFHYRIIICGKRLPAELDNLQSYRDRNIIFAGFVDDIETYFKAADIFLNPVQSGGGIKTKMVEAIGYGATVVATETGATGISRAVCGNKIVVVKDNDWLQFANEILAHKNDRSITPETYYEHYYWENIISKISHL